MSKTIKKFLTASKDSRSPRYDFVTLHAGKVYFLGQWFLLIWGLLRWMQSKNLLFSTAFLLILSVGVSRKCIFFHARNWLIRDQMYIL